MDQSATSDTTDTLIELHPQTLINVGLLGLGLGALSWFLTLLVRQIVFVPLFCGDPANSMCVGATGSAGVIALIATGIVGLLGLVRLGVYRPLLVTLAATISLWGISIWVGNFFWLEALAWTVLLYGIAYIVFTWLVRPRAFPLALALVVIVVVLARIVAVI